MTSSRLFAEYAIDPRVLEWWATDDLPLEFVESVGFGSGRLVAAVPSKAAWRKAARAIVDGLTGVRQERATELLSQMKERMSLRCTSSTGSGAWSAVTLAEHALHPFEGLVMDGDEPAPVETLPSAIGALSRSDRWRLDRQATVPAQASEIARLLGPLMRTGRQIIVVDPYLGPASRFMEVVGALFLAASGGRCCGPPDRIEIHTSSKLELEPSQFTAAMTSRVGKVVPDGWEVRVVRWNAVGLAREDIHDRFVMTNLGGVAFLRGLGETPGKTRLDVMDRSRFAEVWHDYAGRLSRFERYQEDLVITQQSRPSAR